MSTLMADVIKCWTTKRKAALVWDITQGKASVAEASRAYGMPLSEMEGWVEDGKRAW